MKVLDRFLLKTYVAPFVLTFLVVLFVFLMQFLWKYVDDLVGKGLEITILLRLIFYISFTFMPLSIPLAALLSGLITFGNLAEKNELTAMKSAGISLYRIVLPLSVFALGLSVLTFVLANNVMPFATLKSSTLIHDIQSKKLALNIDEGIFYRDIDKYILRIGKKDNDNQTIHDILVYDHRKNTSLTTLTYAKHGYMVMSEDKKYLILTMKDGFLYDENVRYDASTPPSELPILRGTFESEKIRFDLSSFQFQRSDEDFYKDSYDMLSVRQLNTFIDTMRTEVVSLKTDAGNSLLSNFRYISLYYVDSLPLKTLSDSVVLSQKEKQRMYANAIQLAREQGSFLDFKTMEYESKEKQLWRYEIEWHRKYVLAVACILLFFIGAPLGAIIRKGGLGVPFAVSILIFVIYWATGMTGERMSRVGTVPSYFGMWLSTIILSPLAIFLIYKASVEAGLTDIANIKQQINNLKIIKFWTKILKKF